MTRPQLELEPGEELRALTHASFRGAAAASARATFALGSSRMRMKAFDAWRDDAEASGFPTASPEMVLACTDRRVLVCRTTFWTSRPSTLGGAVALHHIAAVSVVRRGLIVACAFALTNGAIVEVEAMRARQLRRFANAVTEALTAAR